MDDIYPDPDQPRKNFDEKSLEELASSIKEKGVLQPILVVAEGNGYRIISGERRYRACKMLGMERIPAIVKQNIKDKREIREIQIIENLQREDVSQIERARSIRDLLVNSLEISEDEVLKKMSNYMFKKDITEEEKEKIDRIARIVGKAPRTMVRWLKLLELPEEVQKKLDSPNSPLTMKHIEHIFQMKDVEEMMKVIEEAEKENSAKDESESGIDGINIEVKQEVKEKQAVKEVSMVNSIYKKLKSLETKIPSFYSDYEARQKIKEKIDEIIALGEKLKRLIEEEQEHPV